MKTNNRRYLTCLVLGALILLHLVTNVIWLRLDTTELMHDAHQHFMVSLAVYKDLKVHVIPTFSRLFDQLVMHRWHGVVIGYITAPFYFLIGTSEDAGVAVSSAIFMSVLILATYGIGRLVSGPAAGLTAAALVGFYPALFNQERIYMLDLPLTALVAVSTLFLLKSECFRRLDYTVLWAVVSGIGMLTKVNFLGYLFAPTVFVAVLSFSEADTHEGRPRAYRLLTALAIAVVMMAVFLRHKGWEVWARLYECSWANPVFHQRGGSLFESLRMWLLESMHQVCWYIQELMNNTMSFPLFFIFLAGLFGFARGSTRYKTVLILGIVFPVLALSFLFHRLEIDRYLLPLLPATALVSAVGLHALSGRFFKRAAIASTLLIGVFQFFAVSYECNFLPEGTMVSLSRPVKQWISEIVFFRRDFPLVFRNRIDRFDYPQQVRWPWPQVLAELRAGLTGGFPSVDVYFLDPLPQMSEPIESASLLNDYPITVHLTSLSVEDSYKDKDVRLHLLDMMDYVAALTAVEPGMYPPEASLAKRFSLYRIYFFGTSAPRFSSVGIYALPDGRKLQLFKNKQGYVRIGTPRHRLYFREGKWKWFYGDAQITKDGFGSTFSVNGSPYRTSNAAWAVTSSSPTRLSATARWPDSSVTQEWEFEILNDTEAELRLTVNSTQPCLLKNLRFSFVATPLYRTWQADRARGTFSSRKVLTFDSIDLPKEGGEIFTLRPRGRSALPAVTIQPACSRFLISPLLKFKKDLRVVIIRIKEKAGSNISLSEQKSVHCSIRFVLAPSS